MYHKTKILTGILVFVLLAAFPLWNRLISTSTQAAVMPMPVVMTGSDHCVESREFMRAKHMVLLNHWRNEAVRENKREYVSSTGEHYRKSLTKTCLKCHSNKKEFCDRCHKAANVDVYCFDCHVSPQKNNMAQSPLRIQKILAGNEKQTK